MPSTYTLNNGIELIGTGEQSGTWGDTTNTNFELLDTALDGQVSVTLAATGSSGSPNTLPISDGASSNGRNRLVIFGDGGDLGGTAFVQLTPNDAEKIIYVRNNLSGSRSILLFQGTYNASNDYEVPAGTTAVVFFNGAGSGAVAANVFNNAFFDSLRLGSVSVDKILDEDNMASNDAAALATQQSIKAYVDSQVGTVDTLAEILANGNTTGGTDIVVSVDDVISLDNGTNALPSLTTTGDLNTGLYFPAADKIAITTGGTERVIVDSSGNVGIGTSSPATQASVQNSSTSLGLEIDTTSGFASGPTLRGYYRAGSSYKPIAMTGSTVHFGINDVEKMRIDSSGRVGIGAAPSFSTLELTADKTTADNLQLTLRGSTNTNKQMILGFDTTSDKSFITSQIAGSAQKPLVINASAVGIGSSAPGMLLEVDASSGSANDIARFSGRNSGGLTFRNATANEFILHTATSDALIFGTNGNNERMRIDSSGNVGIGTSSPNSYSSQTTLTINGSTYGRLDLESAGTLRASLFSTTGSTTLSAATDVLSFDTSGGEAMRIDASGNVGIGNTSSGYVFTSDETRLAVGDGSEHAAIQIYSGTTKWGGLEFADDATNGTGQGFIGYYHPSNYMQFNTSGTEAMRIDSSGNLLVGKTSGPNYNVVGVDLTALGEGQFTVSSNPVLQLNRQSTDGDIAVFRKDGTTVGSIGSVASGTNLYMSAASGVGLGIGGDNLYPVNASGASTDGSLDIGDSTARFKDLYLSGGVYLGGTGAANKLDDYEEGTWTPVINGGSSNPSSPVYGEQLGSYTKVGNTVTVNCVVKINSLSSNGSGSVEIGGLPFSGKTQSGLYQTSAINIEGLNTALTSDSIIGLLPSSSTTFYIYYNNAATGGMAQITWGTYWVAGSRLRFNFTYFV